MALTVAGLEMGIQPGKAAALYLHEPRVGNQNFSMLREIGGESVFSVPPRRRPARLA
jgi:hypothetical protein